MNFSARVDKMRGVGIGDFEVIRDAEFGS